MKRCVRVVLGTKGERAEVLVCAGCVREEVELGSSRHKVRGVRLELDSFVIVIRNRVLQRIKIIWNLALNFDCFELV